MKIRLTAAFCIFCLGTFFLMQGLGSVVYAQGGALDSLTLKLLASPKERWDSILSANRGTLDAGARPRLLDQALRLAEQTNVGEAQLYVEVADEIDYHLGNKRDYRGVGQYLLGDYYLEHKNYETALSLSDNILRRNPGSHYGHLLKGRVKLYTNLNKEAVVELKIAVEADRNSEEAHFSLGHAYVKENNAASALTEFETVLKINPQNAYARDAVAYLKGEAKTKTSESKEAMAHFDKAEGFFSAGKHVEAIEEYKLAIQADPKFGKAYVYMGDSYLQLGQRDEAIKCYQKGIELDPKDRQAHRFLGGVYEKMFDETKNKEYLDLAINCFQNAVNVDPSYQGASKDLERAKQKKLRLK
ncbi:MAG: tetratricopeptide repeat protein [Thermodesulfobacteriota bacterium]